MSIEDTYLKTLHERLSKSEFGETVLACKTFIESEIRLLNTIVRNRGHREMVLNDELLPILIHCGVFSDVPLEDKIERLIEISTVQRNKKIDAVCRYLLISFWNKEGIGEQIGKHLSLFNSINRQSISGKTILMIIADIETFDHQSYSAFKMESIIADNITTVCQILLSRGASVNSVAEDGQTPLHLAVAAQNAPLCLLLLEAIKIIPTLSNMLNLGVNILALKGKSLNKNIKKYLKMQQSKKLILIVRMLCGAVYCI